MNEVPLRRNRDFVLLQLGQGLSTLGSTSTYVAYPLLVLALTHSPAKAGAVGFANVLPYALFALLAGVAADRVDRKRLMIAMDLVRAGAMASIVAALAAGVLTFWQVAAVAFVEGSAFVFFNLAEVGALRSVVSRRQLPEAAAAEQGRYAAVTLAGPSLGGALFGLGRSLPFLGDALSYAGSILTLVWMRTPFQETREPDPAPVRRQVREGVAWLWANAYLRTTALIFAVGNFAFSGIYLVFVVLAKRDGFSPAAIGALIAVFGGVSLAGSVAAPRLARLFSMRSIMVGNEWLSAAIVLCAIAPGPYVLLACTLPIAFFSPSLNSVVVGYRTAITPDHLVGRVSSVARNLAQLAAPLGPLTAGLLLDSFSARTTMLVLGGIALVVAVWTTASPSIRNAPSLSELEQPPDAPPATMEA
ncbi:MAG TPA: MFS transporter [Gaiellaceae bacterium]|nr:MFS transporter [Gaiellaceae bacterium]